MREVDDAADRLRIDRWLWCARLFKTRSQAAQSVRSGHVRLNGERVKPAHAVKVGDALHIARDETAERDVVITAIPWRRGPAPEALRCYAETPESVERRRIAAEQRSVAVVRTADGGAAGQANTPPPAARSATRGRQPLTGSDFSGNRKTRVGRGCSRRLSSAWRRCRSRRLRPSVDCPGRDPAAAR